MQAPKQAGAVAAHTRVGQETYWMHGGEHLAQQHAVEREEDAAGSFRFPQTFGCLSHKAQDCLQVQARVDEGLRTNGMQKHSNVVIYAITTSQCTQCEMVASPEQQ